MSTNKEAWTYSIENGPNRDTLIDSFKYTYDKDASLLVNFGIAIGYTKPKDDATGGYIPARIKEIRIASIKHEDSSGYLFSLTGFIQANLRASSSFAGYLAYWFEADYNAKTRKGTITFTEC